MKTKQWLVGLGLLLFGENTGAQTAVSNDNIENRRPLFIDTSPLLSRTDGCTVQWQCVDRQAAYPCIEFHNDQWFEFTPVRAGTHYPSVRNQACRDIRGVQVLVLTGTICRPETYRYWRCYSAGSQDDVAFALDSLVAGQPYLINIDGFLHDFCRFELAVSTTPPPFTLLPALAPVTANATGLVVELRWPLTDSLRGEVVSFVVQRRYQTENKLVEVARVSVEADAAGQYRTDYAWTDSLSQPGGYTYRVVGVSAAGLRYLLKELEVLVALPQPVATQPTDVLTVDLPKRRQNLALLLFDADTNKLLLRRSLMTSPKSSQRVQINVARFRQAGVRRFRVVAQAVEGKAFRQEWQFAD